MKETEVLDRIAKVKQLRKDLDVQLQVVKKLEPKSRNLALCITHTEDAILRLGLELKELAEQNPTIEALKNPYPNSYNPKSTIIDKTADNLKL